MLHFSEHLSIRTPLGDASVLSEWSEAALIVLRVFAWNLVSIWSSNNQNLLKKNSTAGQFEWNIFFCSHNPQLIENWSTGNVRRFTNTVVLVFQMLFINKLLFSLYSLMSGINQKLLPPGIKGLKQYNIVTHFIFISVLIFKIFCVFNMRKMISKHNNLYKEDLILYVINQLLKFVLRYAS